MLEPLAGFGHGMLFFFGEGLVVQGRVSQGCGDRIDHGFQQPDQRGELHVGQPVNQLVGVIALAQSTQILANRRQMKYARGHASTPHDRMSLAAKRGRRSASNSPAFRLGCYGREVWTQSLIELGRTKPPTLSFLPRMSKGAAVSLATA